MKRLKNFKKRYFSLNAILQVVAIIKQTALQIIIRSHAVFADFSSQKDEENDPPDPLISSDLMLDLMPIRSSQTSFICSCRFRKTGLAPPFCL